MLQIKNYKPVAFVDLPNKNIKHIALLFSGASLIVTFAIILLSFLTFATLIPEVSKEWVFYCFTLKAIAWAPFLGWEYYDMIFE